MNRQRVVTIMGTRPEAIKMMPVVRELNRRHDLFDHLLVATGQHREMLDQVLAVFGQRPDIDLDLMQHNQSLGGFAARAMAALSELFTEIKPDAVLVQGDTTTVTIAALAAFYQGIRVGHVEAGLRSFDLHNPFPEEMNRKLAGSLSDMHFAPTEGARRNLLREGVPTENIFVTGNTIVDALRSIPLDGPFTDARLNEVDFDRRVLLVTAHRRENHGLPMHAICDGLRAIIDRFADVEIVYPVHLNPNVRQVVMQQLGGLPRFHLVEPVGYTDLLRLMRRSHFILSDSGGIQEEAPSFHKPVLVLRDTTERPEVIECGAGRLVGTDAERIFEEAALLLSNVKAYEQMSRTENPFGDGRAAERIVEVLAQRICGLYEPSLIELMFDAEAKAAGD
ncbi:MAG: non-hydrolyzing UDP-N-acetylglucosamine 2-epimerase [Blastocatellia bacterium]